MNIGASIWPTTRINGPIAENPRSGFYKNTHSKE